MNDLVPGLKLKLQTHKKGYLVLEGGRCTNPEGIKRAVRALLRNFGVDTSDENFKGTPLRVTRMWTEWLSRQELQIKVFPTTSSSAVILTNHPTVSVCPHHLLPFECVVSMAYIPNGFAVGLSKMARLADLICSSFALQEHIPEAITKILDALLQPLGTVCHVRARHGCMRLRGVRTRGDVVTTALTGVFFEDARAREEFLLETQRR